MCRPNQRAAASHAWQVGHGRGWSRARARVSSHRGQSTAALHCRPLTSRKCSRAPYRSGCRQKVCLVEEPSTYTSGESHSASPLETPAKEALSVILLVAMHVCDEPCYLLRRSKLLFGSLQEHETECSACDHRVSKLPRRHCLGLPGWHHPLPSYAMTTGS